MFPNNGKISGYFTHFKNILAGLLFLSILLTGCSNATQPTLTAPLPSTQSNELPKATDTQIPTTAPSATRIRTSTPNPSPTMPPIPTLTGLENIPDPKISNPEFFDIHTNTANSAIVHFVETMQLAGIIVDPGNLIQKLEYRLLQDHQNHPFIVGTITLTSDEAGELAGEYPLLIADQNPETGTWLWSEVTLRNLADKAQILLGAMATPHRTETIEKYRNIFLQNYNLVETHIDGYAGVSDEMYDRAEIVLDFAEKSQLPVLYLHLVFDEMRWYPESMQTAKMTPAQAEGELRKHIREIMEVYTDRITYWTVVNEAIGGDAKEGFTRNPWYNALGSDYIRIAFDEARKTQPNAVLIYNDFDLEKDANKRKQVKKFLQPLIDAGLVDAVGMQLHIGDTYATDQYNPEETEAAMREIGNWGVKVIVTEFDVNMTHIAGSPEEKLTLHALIYGRMLKACINSGSCSNFTSFGFSDIVSAYGEDRSPEAINASPLVFDSDINPKPAYYALSSSLLNHLICQQDASTSTMECP